MNYSVGPKYNCKHVCKREADSWSTLISLLVLCFRSEEGTLAKPHRKSKQRSLPQLPVWPEYTDSAHRTLTAQTSNFNPLSVLIQQVWRALAGDQRQRTKMGQRWVGLMGRWLRGWKCLLHSFMAQVWSPNPSKAPDAVVHTSNPSILEARRQVETGDLPGSLLGS